MSEHDYDLDDRLNTQSLQAKFWRFVKYLSTRKMECWGFFAAGYILSAIF